MGAIETVLKYIAPNTTRRIEKEARSRSEPVSEDDFGRFLGGDLSWTGIPIDRLAVMGLPIVWACIKVLSETLASFPLILYEGTVEGKTRKRAEDHPLYDLLHDEPNPQQDAFTFVEQLEGHLGVYGNGYANIVRNGTGYIRELWPLNPERILPFRQNGELLYEYTPSSEYLTTDIFFRSNRGRQFSAPVLSSSEVFHIHAFGFDGIRGYAPLELQKETMGLALAAKHYAGDFFANNGTPDLAFLHPNKLSETALKRLRDSWKQDHARWGKKHSPIILEEGIKPQELNVSPDKAQLIEVQKFLTIEICRVYRMQPNAVQDLERATFSNIEQQDLDLVQHTMRPWVIRWESAIRRQLLGKKDRKKFYPEFYMDAILRGDVLTRANVYAARIGSGQMSPNEARRKEQENDREGGDTYYVPLNWVDADAPVPEPVNPGQDTFPAGTEENSLRESRSIRSAKSRRAIAASFGILLKDSAARIVRKECRDLRKAVSEQLKLRDANTFDQWMEKYYRELPDYIRKQVTPVYQAFSNAVRTEIANELGIDETVSAEDEIFVREFVDTFVKRYVSASTGQMKSIVKSSAVEGMADLLDERLTEWESSRAEKISMNEKTQASNAFAKNIYRLAGIASLVWVAMGSDPCEYCRQMDGMSTNIQDDFAYNGEEIPDDRSLGIGKSIGHPPLHRGCQCQIMAG